MDDDDVIDYMIKEAVAIKVNKEDEKEMKAKEQTDWRSDKEGLAKLREAAGG